MTALKKIFAVLPALPLLVLGGNVSLPLLPAGATPSAETTAACPYLNQSSDRDTATTTSVYDSRSRALNIQVERSVPEMFWPIAESRTRDRVSKILDQCPNLKAVHVTFASGQKLTVRRTNEK